jgi:phospholipid/cholesterol/gamma-HCH transport system substrate-binding protein
MERDRADLAVGLTVLAALALLVASSMRIGACALLEPAGTRLVARFDDAAGVEPRTEILIAGVRVGEVEQVSLEQGRARMLLRVEADGVAVPADSTVAIRSRGLLGERVVEIVRGESDRALGDGDVITRSVEAPNLDVLIDDLSAVAGDIKAVTRSVRYVLGGAEGEEAVAAVVEDVRAVARGLRALLDENSDRFARTLANFDTMAEDLSSFSSQVADLAENNEQTVGEMLQSFATTSQRLSEAVEDLAAVSARVEEGEGTLGRLLADEGLYTKVEDSVTELQRTLAEVRRAAEDAQEQLPVTVLGSLVGSLF